MSPDIHPTSIVLNCTLGNNISIGPFCFLSDSTIEDGVSIEGNVRIEKSVIREKSDSFKFANYDGTGKGNFIIGSNVFFGCNTVISVKA